MTTRVCHPPEADRLESGVRGFLQGEVVNGADRDGHSDDVDEGDDCDLAQLWCGRLGLGRPTRARQLRGGRSGSLVLALETDGTPIVIKVTDDPDRLTRAEREARLLGSQSLDGVAPRLVAWATGPEWVAIATRAGTPLCPATRIDLPTWTALAGSLARIHCRVIDLEGLPLRQAFRHVPDEECLQPWVELGVGADARRAAMRVAESETSPLPLALEHGDAHLDNALRDVGGRLFWVDWQEACVGDGIDDLVFCWQRAEFAGAQPPRAQMTAAYAKTRHLSPRELQPMINEVELRLLIHSWPPFLSFGTSASRASLSRRLTALVNA